MSAATVRETFVVDDLTKAAQRQAADPRASAWVSANAGAGKTKVLTDRVVRLLLDGAPPARILCLTFTKAAAANMSIRVFRVLGRWVTLDDAALSAELTELTGERPARKTLQVARRLFARAVETPGGLKIETLHALCERLLHMFPFEANVPARFVVLDETQAAEAFRIETGNVLADAIGGGHRPLGEALAVVGPEATGDALRKAIRSAMRARDVLDSRVGLDGPFAALADTLGVRPGDSAAAIEARMLDGGLGDLTAFAGRLRTGKATDDGIAERLLAAAAAAAPAEALETYLGVFFTKEGAPKADRSLGTKAVPEDAKQALCDERDRLEPLRDALRGVRALERTRALFTLAGEIHRRVEAQKARLGALDFDDLIHKTLDLLGRVDSTWVLYKLDRGVDHVLIDEAQDTNPHQWEILRRITAEFASGEGAREVARTRFAVGDPKQSIYSFQGAEPREFETTRRAWQRAAAGADLAFEDVHLNLSFRSAGGVLRAVDATFAIPEHYEGLSFEDAAVGTTHSTARVTAPGTVELWPIEEPADEPEPDAWAAPVDAPETNAPAIVTARRVARAALTWITAGDETGRVWRPGDILILVRKRSAAFEEVIRAMKALGVPVAGQDRLDIAAHIAVNDLVAVGRAGLLPADDLTLAGALKTPLVGLDDDDLVRIAGRRDLDETLEDSLARHAAAGDPAAIRGHAALTSWITLAACEGPFGFYAALLGARGGRRALVSRLGGEAGDAIDVFLMTAAQAEQAPDAPSLGGFLARYDTVPGRGEGGHTVKRDLDSGRDEVRVMTVHGAKGLEAPVVVVIDGCEALGRNDPPLLPLVPGAQRFGHGAALLPPVWAGAKAGDCEAVTQARATLQSRAREEHNRLLYVAMTRAADRLVIAPYRGHEAPSEAAWCEMVRTGLERSFGLGEVLETPHGPATLWRDGGAAEPAAPSPSAAEGPPDLPAWLEAPVPAEVEAAPPVTPSGALGAADTRRQPGQRQADSEARRRGTLIHSLVEHLPRIDPAQREAAATAFVRARAPGFDRAKQDGIVAATLHLFAEPDLAPLFAPEARAEVTLSGRVVVGGVSRPVFGRVDRLAIAPDTVWVADFKTGRPPRDGAPLPRAEAGQIALYAALLAEIYPRHRVVPMLVWTSGPVIRRLDADAVAAALDTLAQRAA
ncbi:double-strand break repair helicase AddA [Methylobacterium sp. Leaf88]|uniref:double-strand break repair helicase AddA n=1 Tax=Methylobacterium sp. Leaf88 TaxID=1736244 RepID=UPI0006FC85EC|nr:double-strand break repair helicase AddA [Methylobacterium sp. Leaf88]KQO70150.1 double-strand break repair protein AddA [Methylobacterium sp. Leaf88]